MGASGRSAGAPFQGGPGHDHHLADFAFRQRHFGPCRRPHGRRARLRPGNDRTHANRGHRRAERRADRRHRLAHPARPARSGSAGRVRRPRRYRPHRPHLDRRGPAAPAGLRRRAQQPLQQFGQFRQPARWRRGRRRRGRDRPALSRLAPHSRPRRRAALRQRRLGLGRPWLGGPQFDPGGHDRAGRGAAGRRFGHLRLGRDRGRGQHHHPQPTERVRRFGAARRVRRRRRLQPELFAELGRRHERRPHPHRDRRQLCEAGRGQLRGPRDLALPDAGRDLLRGRRVQLGHAQRPLHRARSSGSNPDRSGDRPRTDARRLPPVGGRRRPVQFRPLQLHPDPA